MTPLEKIDKILNFLKERSDLSASFSKEYIWNLYISKTPELKINRQLYDEILKQLIEDGYIRENKTEDSQPNYHLALKGLIFDSYQNQELEIQKLKSTTQKLTYRNYVLTALIALGTLIAAWYYLTQLWDYYFCK
jgi:hypothetical protein